MRRATTVGKPCRKCGSIERYADGDCAACAVRRSSAVHARRMAGPDARSYQQRRQHLARLRRYGLSVAQYSKLMARQLGLCAICRNAPATHVDHDHQTGTVRGLLCLGCNTGIGSLQDSIQLLEAAIDYLSGGAQ